MTDYTPTTDEVRDAYVDTGWAADGSLSDPRDPDEFDRWLRAEREVQSRFWTKVNKTDGCWLLAQEGPQAVLDVQSPAGGRQEAFRMIRQFTDDELAAHDAQVAAQALRDAADELEQQGVELWGRNGIAIRTLRFRANQITKEDR